MKKLDEGMRIGDLEDLVLPMISVDEFESKIDEEAIVFGFYVSDHDAAQDLNRFIQKSPVSILDTEVSPAPDRHGYYFVFFEILPDEHMPDNVSQVLDEVSGLAKIDHWQLRIRGVDDLIPMSPKVLKKHFAKKDREGGLDEQVLRYLKPSGLSGANLSEGALTLYGMGKIATFKVVAIVAESVVSSTFALAESAIETGLSEVAKEIRLARMLGEGWSVTRISGLSIVKHEDTDQVLVLADR